MECRAFANKQMSKGNPGREMDHPVIPPNSKMVSPHLVI